MKTSLSEPQHFSLFHKIHYRGHNFFWNLCVVWLVMIGLFSLLTDVIFPASLMAQNDALSDMPPMWAGGEFPHFLGTDTAGVDLLGYMFHSTQFALLIGFCASLLAGFIGVILAFYTILYQGLLAQIIIKISQLWLFFPFVLLVALLFSRFHGNVVFIIFALAFVQWNHFFHVIYKKLCEQMQTHYIHYTAMLGFQNLPMLLHVILPNYKKIIFAIFLIEIATAIVIQIMFSMVGLTTETAPRWGNLLMNVIEGNDNILWWSAIFPIIFLGMTVLSFNYLGDRLRRD